MSHLWLIQCWKTLINSVTTALKNYLLGRKISSKLYSRRMIRTNLATYQLENSRNYSRILEMIKDT